MSRSSGQDQWAGPRCKWEGPVVIESWFTEVVTIVETKVVNAYQATPTTAVATPPNIALSPMFEIQASSYIMGMIAPQWPNFITCIMQLNTVYLAPCYSPIFYMRWSRWVFNCEFLEIGRKSIPCPGSWKQETPLTKTWNIVSETVEGSKSLPTKQTKRLLDLTILLYQERPRHSFTRKAAIQNHSEFRPSRIESKNLWFCTNYINASY